MLRTIVRSFRLVVALAVLVCGVYPAVVALLGQGLFPRAARGSLVHDQNGVPRGSALIGQAFSSARYFQGRPSAAGTGYDALKSGASNFGPLNAKLQAQVRAEVARLRATNPGVTLVPNDLALASASGLDPHISPEAARLQAARVAQARGMAPEVVHGLIEGQSRGPFLGLLGAPTVNVFLLNRELDASGAAR